MTVAADLRPYTGAPYLKLSSTATATATVMPTIGLLPLLEPLITTYITCHEMSFYIPKRLENTSNFNVFFLFIFGPSRFVTIVLFWL